MTFQSINERFKCLWSSHRNPLGFLGRWSTVNLFLCDQQQHPGNSKDPDFSWDCPSQSSPGSSLIIIFYFPFPPFPPRLSLPPLTTWPRDLNLPITQKKITQNRPKNPRVFADRDSPLTTSFLFRSRNCQLFWRSHLRFLFSTSCTFPFRLTFFFFFCSWPIPSCPSTT